MTPVGAGLSPVRPRPAGGFPLEGWLAARGIEARGVIHVGAHLGEELEDYLGAGFRRILFVEANPELFEALEAHLEFWRGWIDAFGRRFGLRTTPRLDALLGAVDQRDGHAHLYLTQTPQSSVLRPVDPTLHVRGGVEVPCFTLPTAIRTAGWEPRDFNCLVLDTQGAELRALAGAGSALDSIDLLVTEVHYEARYLGCPAPEEVERFVVERGFARVADARLHPEHPVGDRYFQREARR